MPRDAGYGPRSRLQTVWLASAAGLLAVLVAGGGLLVWRGVTAGPPPHPGLSAAAAGQTPTVAAFGAPQLVEGVPWGFALDGHGAAAAAVMAVAVTGQPEVVFDPDRFETVAAVVFDETEAEVQARQVAAARTEFELSAWAAQPASRRMYHLIPLAVRLVAFDPDRPAAQAEVWAMTLVGVGDAGGAVFTTSTVDLEAAGGTWQVVGLDSVEGPVPLTIESPSPPGRTRGLLSDSLPVLPLPLPATAGSEDRP